MSGSGVMTAELLRWVQPAEKGGFPEEASRLLAALGTVLLSEPTDEVLASLAESGDPPLPEPFGERLSALAAAAATTDSLAARVEFTRLFYHPRGAACPPWECVELDETPLLMGPRHEAVLRFFHRAGVEPQRPTSESADHAGLELALLALLAARVARGEDDGALFEEFWSSHAERWMGSFAERLTATARLEIYAAAGRLLRDVVTESATELRQEALRLG